MRRVQLSDRLLALAGYVRKGERVADIGTDHGLLPIYLKQNGISDCIIAGDVNQGPLEKMAGNLERHLSGDWEGIQMRLGSGLDILEPGEADCAIIAGMGGRLMIEILEDSMETARSLKRLILQPRNAQDTLRKWLLFHGFTIEDETLVRERKYIWEILEVQPLPPEALLFQNPAEQEREQYDIGYELIRKKDPLLYDFIEQKAGIEQEILDGAKRSDLESAVLQRQISEKKIAIFRRIQKDVCRSERID